MKRYKTSEKKKKLKEKNMYFTHKTEDAIIEYNNASDTPQETEFTKTKLSMLLKNWQKIF